MNNISGNALSVSEMDKYYWEDQYQNALDKFNKAYRQSKRTESYIESLIACSNVYKIVVQFENEALRASKKLVHESKMSFENRSLLPDKHIGGVAGGDKIEMKGIFLKLHSKKSEALYDGAEFAMKEPSHALRTLRKILVVCQLESFAEASTLSTNLMANVNYLGHRVQCSSILRVNYDNSQTLTYGSSNAGDQKHQRVEDKDEELSYLIENVARVCGVKRHIVGANNREFMYGGIDVEGHCVKSASNEKKRYLLDLHSKFSLPSDRE
jgi:hypothetical protein